MLAKLTPRLLLPLLLLSVATELRAQDCNPPAITANAKSSNMFTPEQEMVLGELVFRRMSRDIRVMRNEQLDAYLTQLGRRLIKHLPNTGLKFQFHIIDIPEANAFNLPGGYVLMSRKLIGFANNEDEIVGVLAHELGHAVVRHAAVDFSEVLKKVLNVSEVGDRKDITEKYNLLIERQRTKRAGRTTDHESAQQQEADRIGLFAMVAAGYDPTAFSSLFDRLVETKGKTGNWFTDIFGKVRPEQKRLREMIKLTDRLPPECRENRSSVASSGFLNWQAEVVSYNEARHSEQLSGLLWKKQLAPGLRSDVSHLAFSPDGAYLLAQDDFAITVIRREPLSVEFIIPTTEAQEASFTPDGQFIVFGTESLRFERWSIASRKPVEVRELVVRRDCWEHEFSPDGKFLTCVDFGLNVNILETQTAKKIFEKKQFYELSFFELITWAARTRGDSEERRALPFFRIEYSPNSQYVAISRSEYFRFAFRIDGMVADESENTLLALDLSTMKPINVGGEMKKLSKRPFIFVTSDKVLGLPGSKTEDGGMFSFPGGKRLARFPFGARFLKHTANPNFLILKPIANASLGIFDVTRNALVNALNKEDATIWNNIVAFEGTSGRVILMDFKYNEETKKLEAGEQKSIDLPASIVSGLDVAEVSDNFKWLAISSKTRGALWSLDSGERKIFVRGFSGALIGNDGAAVGDFPKLAPLNHSLAFMNAANGAVSVLREIPEYGARQYGRFVLVRESMETSPAAAPENKSDNDSSAGKLRAPSLSRNVRINLRDVVSDKVVWSREFPKEAPLFFFDQFSGRLIFYWTLGSNAGKQRLREDSVLAARSKQLGNTEDDYLLEVIDAFAGKSVGTVLLETGKGSFDILDAYSEGDWLVLHDSTNRVLSFSIKGGELNQRFIGAHGAINPAKSQIVVENYPGELTIYDLETGEDESRLLFSGRVAFVRFSLDGKRLFVLTDQQTAYAFDVDKIARQEQTSSASNQ